MKSKITKSEAFELLMHAPCSPRPSKVIPAQSEAEVYLHLCDCIVLVEDGEMVRGKLLKDLREACGG